MKRYPSNPEMFLRKKEMLFLGGILLLALASFLIFSRRTSSGVCAQITFDKTVVHEISLSEDRIYHIEGRLPVTLEVKEGKIRFINSVCPDHICEAYGWIDAHPEHAVCMPALVSVYITEDL